MSIVQVIEVFALVTGVAYAVLEILQRPLMWILGIATGAACAWSFATQNLYASMGLNIYYVAVSFLGLYRWHRDAVEAPEAKIHLRKLPSGVIVRSAVAMVICTAGLSLLLRFLGDSMTVLDAAVAVMSAIATLWLTKCYLEQWMLWIVVDVMSAVLCLLSGMYAMAVLYLFYVASAVYGLFHWKKLGEYINETDN
ncbi:MAG: nicotinamide mononucleotide transporter [Bacteroidales bacterium]|nr:nicotinamide mononucleotide transporter [Bacteroidales bacterium]